MTELSQTANIQPIELTALIDFFRSKAESKTPSTAKSYIKAIQSLSSYCRSKNFTIFSKSLPSDWLISLWANGTTYKTALLYTDILASLSKEAVSDGLLSEVDHESIATLRSRLRAEGERLWMEPITDAALERVLTLLRLAHRQQKDVSKATDILLLALLEGGVSPVKIASSLTRDNILSYKERHQGQSGEAIKEIGERNQNPRRKYIFDLDQSRKTPAQIEREVNRLFSELGKQRNIPIIADADSTVKAIWSMLALRVGASPATILARFGKVPASMPILSLIEKNDRVEETSLQELVNATILDNPKKWFAMKLRPHVSLEEVESRMDIFAREITRPSEIFYPHEEIAKRIGKKLVFRQRPFIADVAFIRSRQTDLLPLFAKIGDLAWCYTVSGKPGSPYAAISPIEFNRFQIAIGRFSPDIDPRPLNTITPNPGEPVILISGPFQGREAIVEEAIPETTDSPTIIYRLKIVADNGIEWRVKTDARQLRPSGKTA